MTSTFYDQLAPYYHLLYGSWEEAISEQAEAIASLLSASDVQPGQPILDAACGIGTQAIGLAVRGYVVSASDLSPGAVQRLESELSRRKLQATAYVDDLRTLSHTQAESMAAVIACDNSLPHLLSDNEILQSLVSCYRCLKPGGIAIFSVRDYSTIERKNPDVRPYGLRREGERRFLAVQVWEWHGDQYDLRMYLTSEAPTGACEAQVLLSRYYAIPISRLMMLMAQAGFNDVRRHDNLLFQPVITGRRPRAV
ncbi:MAG: class I SAM-dependent methyltransferase [Burkholderiaceae bacterium]|nr:class I SAM-dependent methyltransferase [Burkholderiaceae bacterium]